MKYYVTSRLSEKISETPEGFLLCLGVSIARTGKMLYGKDETPLKANSNGQVEIMRDEKEVFRPETIASFEGKPLTVSHPEEFVNPANWKKLSIGILQNVRRGKDDQIDDLVTDILVTDAVGIGLVRKGLREVSCGYEAEYIQTGDGQGIQKNIIGNHLALVEEGRAGPSYAINDHKEGKGTLKMSKKLGAKLKEFFAKTADEAEKVFDEEMPEEKKEEKSKDAVAYDELVQICKDLSAKIEAMGKPKLDEKPKEKEEEKSADAEEPVAKSLEDRLSALEAAVSKIMESEASEEMGDEEKEEEVGDADKEEKGEMVGDTAARVEILAPGLKYTKDVKTKALKQAYGTKEGKLVIESLTGGRVPTFDSSEKVDSLFIAASEVLKVSRANSLASTKKTHDFVSNLGVTSGVITPEKLNEMNAKRYGLK